MNFTVDLSNALKVLKEGGIILYPTDTIWGLGCDATNGAAVDKIFGIKKRREGQSLIVLVNGLTMLERYVSFVPETAQNLLDVADKPLTIIYPRGKNLAPGICAQDGSAGIRVCGDDFCNELITRFRKPVVSTSANISGSPSPGNFPEIDEYILRSADYIVKYRQEDTSTKRSSSIIKLWSDGSMKIIRE